ncbi:hypothetical protein AK830_g11670 [Neonectria ditissima]|uniref:Homeobox domain-containing protein n=1 Tax=Neonectria ditissima TaxID=78410 RepID=A0A0P7B2M9_9HYPO|nr:hypothetical protein AK830_g11670 [Neonectria ditissima]
MLVTRQCDTDHSWPFNKYDPSRKPASPSRMSNPYSTALPAQSEWQGQNPYSPNDGHPFPQSLEPNSNCQDGAQSRLATDSERNALGIHVKQEPRSSQIHKLPGMGLRHDTHPSPLSNPPETQNGPHSLMIAGSVQDKPQGFMETRSQPLGTNSLNPCLSQTSANHNGHGDRLSSAKSEEDDDFDEEDMLDGEGDHSSQTAAERTAARRKMKRFRLTHQQTRFLMSEFAKQPHPDAAHRERLSREIPGLSPRQVQVWFQNRRAKIKRLNVDDRDRMIKMRAVPDDFDNVQALHSPYGAVHGFGTPHMPSPGDLGAQSYAQHIMRPLMIDARREPSNDHSSPTGLTPGFGSIGFGPAASMSTPDMMSPISPATNDRYPYGSHFSAPMNGAVRASNPFGSQNGLESPMEANRQSPHPLQASQFRDSISRARSESGQSPLRSSMAWKGDAIDYANYRGTDTSSNLSERNPSMYQPSHMSAYDPGSYPSKRPPVGSQSWKANEFTTDNSAQTTTGIGYSSISSPHSGSRLRASTATLPLNIDPRDHYRAAGSDVQSHSPSSQSRSTPTSTPYSTPSYTTGYPSAPLAAPTEFSVPRSSDSKSNMQEAQMSAPMAPPSDFSQALHGNMEHHDQARAESHRHLSSGREGHKRKRSLTLPTGSTRPLF